jgi:hypothetical protein
MECSDHMENLVYGCPNCGRPKFSSLAERHAAIEEDFPCCGGAENAIGGVHHAVGCEGKTGHYQVRVLE